MEPLSIILSTIGIIEGITTAYKTVKKISNLPNAFEEVSKQLPLVHQTLQAAKSQLEESPKSADDDRNVITSIIETCHAKATELEVIFRELEKKREADAEAASWANLRSVYRTALAGRKAHRVETLMKAIMKSIESLALLQIFLTPTGLELREEIGKAISKWAEVPPSLEDSEFESAGFSPTMNIATGGKGHQHNVQGNHNTIGKYVSTGSGNSFNFGTRHPPPPTT